MAPFSILRLRGLGIVLALAAIGACASPAPAPRAGRAPTPTPSADAQLVADLTEALKLDATQQQKTRELIAEKIARDERIRDGWAKGGPVRPELLDASGKTFVAGFQAILTDAQRQVFTEIRMRLLRGSAGMPSSP